MKATSCSSTTSADVTIAHSGNDAMRQEEKLSCSHGELLLKGPEGRAVWAVVCVAALYRQFGDLFVRLPLIAELLAFGPSEVWRRISPEKSACTKFRAI